jgi:acyl-CoA thioesterase I
VVVHRGTQLVTGAFVLVLAVLLTLLVSSGATGADAERCARFSAQSQVRERMVTGHGKRVVVLGDSYAVGLGLQDPQTSWPSRLPGRVNVYGFSGSGFSAHASDCPSVAYHDREPQALQSGADLVVVEGGLNDYDRPDTEIRAGFARLMTALAGQQVVVVGPASAPSRAGAVPHVDALLASLAERYGVAYVRTSGLRLDYLDDRLHLTPAGHQAFGDYVAEQLDRLAG